MIFRRGGPKTEETKGLWYCRFMYDSVNKKNGDLCVNTGWMSQRLIHSDVWTAGEQHSGVRCTVYLNKYRYTWKKKTAIWCHHYLSFRKYWLLSKWKHDTKYPPSQSPSVHNQTEANVMDWGVTKQAYSYTSTILTKFSWYH